jgi:hypothetical protein
MMQLNKIIDDVLEEKIDWQKKPKGNFSISDSMLQTKYQILPIEKSYINCSKVDYELGWFLKVTIGNDMAKLSSCSSESEPIVIKIKKDGDDTQRNKVKQEKEGIATACDDFEKLIDITKLKENTSQNVIDLSDEEEMQDDKRMKNELGSKYSLRKTKETNKNGTIDQWFTKEVHAEMSANITKRKHAKKPITIRNVSEPFKSRFDTIKLEELKKAQDELIPKFIEAQTLKEKLHAERKEELRSLQMLDCKHYSDKDLKEFVQSRKEDIQELFTKPYKKGSKSLKEELDCDVDFLIITTAEIMSEDQQLLVMKEVGKLQDPSERGTKDLLLHELIMPYVIVEAFKKAHKLSTKEAINRIKTQEEKRDMFQERSSF